MKRYSESLEQWEQEAYHDGYGADWLADIGEGVKYYAMECESKGRRPTFAGLIRYIDRKRCRPPEGDCEIKGYAETCRECGFCADTLESSPEV